MRMLGVLKIIILLIILSPAVLFLRVLGNFYVIRVGLLYSSRLGHFSVNTELYLCEKDRGINGHGKNVIDILFHEKKICNYQLLKMWSRVIRIWPMWLVTNYLLIDRLIPGKKIVKIPATASSSDRDVLGLLEKTAPHLYFSEREKVYGDSRLREIGIPHGAKFVCLTVRDSSYLKAYYPEVDFSYHDYRDSSIGNYMLAAEELVSRGYIVVRMGAVVREKFQTQSPYIIDYATNGTRSEFMDIYLAANCEFCISQGTGFDGLAVLFRKPILFVNFAPVGYALSYLKDSLMIYKHHHDQDTGRELSLQEIFDRNVGYALNGVSFDEARIRLEENSPEEIKEACVEMVERLEGKWQEDLSVAAKQRSFWGIILQEQLKRNKGERLHGRISQKVGSKFLKSIDLT